MSLAKRVKVKGKEYIQASFEGKQYLFQPHPLYPTNLIITQIGETFEQQIYCRLTTKDKIVVDLGSNIGDSAIFFLAHGAKKVYAFDCDPLQIEMCKQNMKINNFQDKVEVIQAKIESAAQIFQYVKEIKDFQDAKASCLPDSKDSGMVLKLDIEGSEFPIFESDTGVLNLFDEIIMEVHDEPTPIILKLYKMNFREIQEKGAPNKPGSVQPYLGYIFARYKMRE